MSENQAEKNFKTKQIITNTPNAKTRAAISRSKEKKKKN